jgi:hypothetical protein
MKHRAYTTVKPRRTNGKPIHTNNETKCRLGIKMSEADASVMSTSPHFM